MNSPDTEDPDKPPSRRDQIYAELAQTQTRPRNWYSNKRQSGIIGFICPTFYKRTKDGVYPRVQPGGLSKNKLGLLGAHKLFRNAVIGDLNRMLAKIGYKIIEVDLVSCHLKILVDLDLGTPILRLLLTSGGNVWQSLVGSLSEQIREEFSFAFLKAMMKKVAYKALQGGRVDSVEKIHKTLLLDEEHCGKSLRRLSEEAADNKLLKEFDRLNKMIMDLYKDKGKRLAVYTPLTGPIS